MRGVQIAPSVLAADFTKLGEEIASAEEAGAERIHLDVMDGRFVPNISFGPMVVAAARRATNLPLDVHLMIEAPERYLEAFVDAGAHSVTVHQEATPHLHRTVGRIRELGSRAGVAINPATPCETLSEILSLLDLVMVMSVNPGFGGQKYIPASTTKAAKLRDMLAARALDRVEIHVDGGIDTSNAAEAVHAGAHVLIAGSSIFGAGGSVKNRLGALRAAAGG